MPSPISVWSCFTLQRKLPITCGPNASDQGSVIVRSHWRHCEHEPPAFEIACVVCGDGPILSDAFAYAAIVEGLPIPVQQWPTDNGRNWCRPSCAWTTDEAAEWIFHRQLWQSKAVLYAKTRGDSAYLGLRHRLGDLSTVLCDP